RVQSTGPGSRGTAFGHGRLLPGGPQIRLGRIPTALEPRDEDRIRAEQPLQAFERVGDLTGVLLEQAPRGSDRSGQLRRDETQGDDAVCGEVLDIGGRFVDEVEKVRVLATAPWSWLRPCPGVCCDGCPGQPAFGLPPQPI